MLVLTRKLGESVMIEESIELTVVGVKGSQVRLAFKAPKAIAIHRKEIYEKIQQEKQKDLLSHFSVNSSKK